MTATDAPASADAARSRGNFRLGLATFLDNKLALTGLVLVAALACFSFAGPLVYHTDQVNTDLYSVELPPGSPDHILGTDQAGYDQLGRLMVAGRTSLLVGVSAGLLATVIGALWGAVAGFFGGVVDAAMMRVVDALLSVPAIFLLLVIAAMWRPTTWSLVILIGLIAWLVPARLVRGEALSLRVREYVQAVRMMGGGRWRAVSRHIVPNALGTIVVSASFQVADAIIYLAYLSFLGLGLAPPTTDWGGMLSDGVDYVYSDYWWLIYPPGLAIVLVVIGFNFIGDGLRDSFDARLRRR